ncbi:MAG TPA: hypothetical protein VF573_21990, partial [Paraburkholderia sp.]
AAMEMAAMETAAMEMAAMAMAATETAVVEMVATPGAVTEIAAMATAVTETGARARAATATAATAPAPKAASALAATAVELDAGAVLAVALTVATAAEATDQLGAQRPVHRLLRATRSSEKKAANPPPRTATTKSVPHGPLDSNKNGANCAPLLHCLEFIDQSARERFNPQTRVQKHRHLFHPPISPAGIPIADNEQLTTNPTHNP